MIAEEGVETPSPHFLCPPWSGRYGIEVYSTTRVGGFSEEPYDSLNLGLHVNDDAVQVARNRQRIKEELNFRQEPLWLNQVHGNAIVRAEDCLPEFSLKRSSNAAATTVAPKADGAWTQQRNLPLAVLTADCLPVVLATSAHSAYSVQPKSIAVVHAGWRGLAAGHFPAVCPDVRMIFFVNTTWQKILNQRVKRSGYATCMVWLVAYLTKVVSQR